MSFNYVEKGARMPYAVGNSATITKGDVILVGDTHGVALQTIATDSSGNIIVGATSDPTLTGTTIELGIGGVWNLPKATTAGSAIAQGTKVYWDNTGKVVTTTSSGNKQIGYIWATNADADATVQVLINKGV